MSLLLNLRSYCALIANDAMKEQSDTIVYNDTSDSVRDQCER